MRIKTVLQNSQKGVILPIVAVILLVIMASMAAYYLGLKNSKNPTEILKQEMPLTNNILSPTPSPMSSQGNKLYSDPLLGYSLTYPSDWTIQSFDGQSLPYVSFISSDYQMTTGGYEMLERGAMIMVIAQNTSESSIEEKFEKDKFAGMIAQSVKKTSVNGLPAIQYEYSYEAVNAVDTIFIKDTVSYLVKFQFPNNQDKEKYWQVYTSVLASFKTK